MSRLMSIYELWQRDLPLFEFRVDDPVGESLSADTDTFKYTITLKLVQHKRSINKTWNTESSSFSYGMSIKYFYI